MKKVTDPLLLMQLNGDVSVDVENLSDEDRAAITADAQAELAKRPKKVTDPLLLQQLNGGIDKPQDKLLQASQPEQEKPIINRLVDDVGTAAINLPKSTATLFQNIGTAVVNPVDTVQSALNLGNSALQSVLPDSVNDYMHRIAPGTANNQGLAGRFADAYKDRYGGLENIEETFRNDPAGLISDATVALTAGGGLLGKIPALSKAGEALTTAGKVIDPVTNAAKVAKASVPVVGNAAANVVSGLGTHTGAESIKTAVNAGYQGGQKATDFLDNMRGNVPQTDVLDDFKSALGQMRQNRADAYNQGMQSVRSDPTVLSFSPIEAEVNKALNIGQYKGKTIDASASGVKDQIFNAVDDWKNSDPADFHTPEGLDALKQRIGDIRDNTQYGTRSRVVADNVYNAIRKQIVDQAPEYAKTMKDYETASRLIDETGKAFSLGEKSSKDTSMRKLQSLMRNNVNTNYGNRLNLAKELEAVGGANLMEKLAGQSLNSFTPRGMANVTMPMTGLGGYMMNAPMAVPMMMMQSPRMVGEAAYYTGKGAGLLGKTINAPLDLLDATGIDAGLLGNYINQLQY